MEGKHSDQVDDSDLRGFSRDPRSAEDVAQLLRQNQRAKLDTGIPILVVFTSFDLGLINVKFIFACFLNIDFLKFRLVIFMRNKFKLNF